MKTYTILFMLLLGCFSLQAQDYTQTIRGTVIDKESKQPLFGAGVILLGTEPLRGISTDEQGRFRLSNVPVGRHDLKIVYMGYQDLYVPNIMVNSGKEVVLNLEMVEKVIEHKEVVIKADRPKDKPLNEMAVVSARMFTVEETNRYAGALGDPARMAANYAGVSIGSDARNDIIIRGNSPTGLLWRLEGIDIPNPNHFAAQGTTGGPVSILNSNLLSNSDFYTGAFPAEFGNATSGVFDLSMRNGNNEKYEFTAQVGFNGAEAMAEGPISKKRGSSFLISYRYSVLSFFQAVGINLGPAGVPKYQDLSFKIDLPTQKAGTFDIFGVGGKSTITILDEKRTNDNFTYGYLDKDIYFNSDMGVVGISHLLMLGKKAYLKTVIATSTEGHKNKVDSVAPGGTPYNIYNEKSNFFRTSIHSLVNYKINSSNTIKTGIILGSLGFNSLQDAYSHKLSQWINFVNDTGNTWMGQAYSEWKHDFNARFALLAGLHFQYLFLNHTSSLEPRAGLSYKLSEKETISFGYGIHAQMQPLTTYLYTYYDSLQHRYLQTDENLGFTKSEHLVAGYNRQITANLHLKIEAYYQYLFDVPVQEYPGRPLNSFSMLNTGADYYLNFVPYLVNKGVGRNYGAELTFEKFFSNSYYFLLTTSLFDSRYKGSDGVWRNTAFNSHFVANALFGKEFKTGKNSTLTLSGKLAWAGGRYHTPIDTLKSHMAKAAVYDEANAFSQQFPTYFKADGRLAFKLNSKKITQELAFDVTNVTNRKNVLTEIYDPQKNQLKEEYQLAIFPVILYRIQF